MHVTHGRSSRRQQPRLGEDEIEGEEEAARNVEAKKEEEGEAARGQQGKSNATSSIAEYRIEMAVSSGLVALPPRTSQANMPTEVATMGRNNGIPTLPPPYRHRRYPQHPPPTGGERGALNPSTPFPTRLAMQPFGGRNGLHPMTGQKPVVQSK